MKRPKNAPSILDIMKKIEPADMIRLYPQLGTIKPTIRGKYLHWSELKRRDPPENLNHDLWWLGLKMARAQSKKVIPLKDARGRNFSFCLPDIVMEMLHKIDGQATGRIAMPDQVTNPETRARYIVSSLMEEAIKSSQLEGASTTRKIASNMLRSGRKPKNKDEQMILNNYIAMNFVRREKNKELTPELVLDLHKVVTDKTLETPEAAGRLQTSEDTRVSVCDNQSEDRLHVPPPANQLQNRLEELCRFANGQHTDSDFIHPAFLGRL